MLKQTLKGALIASGVASLLSSGVAFAGDKAKDAPKDVKCAGVNECKGKGACHGADNGCSGQNGCKGKGWTKMSEKDCTAKGGKVVAEADKAKK
jgi:hypothetical protein